MMNGIYGTSIDNHSSYDITIVGMNAFQMVDVLWINNMVDDMRVKPDTGIAVSEDDVIEYVSFYVTLL